MRYMVIDYKLGVTGHREKTLVLHGEKEVWGHGGASHGVSLTFPQPFSQVDHGSLIL